MPEHERLVVRSATAALEQRGVDVILTNQRHENWCRAVDTKGIDVAVDTTAKGTVGLARASGRFDLGIVDGVANLPGMMQPIAIMYYMLFGAYAWAGAVRTRSTISRSGMSYLCGP